VEKMAVLGTLKQCFTVNLTRYIDINVYAYYITVKQTYEKINSNDFPEISVWL
jgi:hypothetical protein